MQASILPTFWQDVQAFRTKLQHVCPEYFKEFDADPRLEGELTASSYCGILADYVRNFVDRNRARLTSRQVFDASEEAARTLHVLRWSSKVWQAHEWHRRFHSI